MVTVREYTLSDIPAMNVIWNEIVAEGQAFPQEEELDITSGEEFYSSQSFAGVACDERGSVLGLYILHPNNIGRCGHISNASFAVSSACRGQGVGESLVRHCLMTAKNLGFRVLQFNAVVADNVPALKLYEKLGFTRLGVIPGGFRAKNGEYKDIIPHFISL